MAKATEETLKKVFKPFDFVESEAGSFGYIQEVSINEDQEDFNGQVKYSVNWIKHLAQEKNAWWRHEDLTVVGNMFKEIARCAAHPYGHNQKFIDKIM